MIKGRYMEIRRAKKGSHIPTSTPKYIPYSYMDPLGVYNTDGLSEASCGFVQDRTHTSSGSRVGACLDYSSYWGGFIIMGGGLALREGNSRYRAI